jgi:hypothetical protein
MKVVAWMVAASLLSWLAIAALVDARARTATLFGMIAPLGVAAASWLMAERAWRRNPESLTSLMIGAFVGKMVFFGVYVAAMLKGLSVAPMPFVISFASYFIALHLAEALALKWMFEGAGGLGD